MNAMKHASCYRNRKYKTNQAKKNTRKNIFTNVQIFLTEIMEKIIK
jgi:hypothetical protein